MIYKQVMLTSMARVLTLVTGLIASMLTARYLGPEGRGEYFFVTTMGVLLTQFAHLGLASSNTYLVAQQETLLGRLLINSVWISVMVGLFVSLLTLLMLNLLQVSTPSGTWVLVLVVPSSIFYLLGANLLVGIHQLGVFNAFQIGSNVLVVLLMVYVGASGGHVADFLKASALGWMLVGVCLLACLWHYVRPAERRFWFDPRTFLKGAGYSSKAYLATLLGMFVLKGNVLLLNHFSNGTALGYYSVAAQLNDCLAILPASFGLVLFPSLVSNVAHRWRETKKSLSLVIVLMLVICLLAALFAKPLIQLAFGVRFLPAVAVCWWMLPGTFFLGMISIISQYLAAIGFPAQLILVWFAAFCLMMCGGWILIPRYADQGAAMSLSMAYFFVFIMIWILAKNRQRSFN